MMLTHDAVGGLIVCGFLAGLAGLDLLYWWFTTGRKGGGR